MSQSTQTRNLCLLKWRLFIGLEKGLDVSKYARHEYDWFQMEEIRRGLNLVCPFLDTNPDIPYKIMHEIRLGLAEGYRPWTTEES